MLVEEERATVPEPVIVRLQEFQLAFPTVSGAVSPALASVSVFPLVAVRFARLSAALPLFVIVQSPLAVSELIVVAEPALEVMLAPLVEMLPLPL